MIAFVKVKKGGDGIFYSIGSGLVTRDGYLKNKPLLWERAQTNQLKESPSAVTGKSNGPNKTIHQSEKNTSQKDGDQKETWQMTLDEFKNKNPELSGNRAKSRWAGEVHDAWNAGHAVPEKTLSELKEIRPTFIPDGLADNDTLLERLGSKITAHIENEISKKQLEHQKELTIFKRKETLDRKKGIDFKESHEKHGGNLVSLTKEIESLKDELHERTYTEKTNGKHALRIVQQYRDVQLKKHNELKSQQKDRPAKEREPRIKI